MRVVVSHPLSRHHLVNDVHFLLFGQAVKVHTGHIVSGLCCVHKQNNHFFLDGVKLFCKFKSFYCSCLLINIRCLPPVTIYYNTLAYLSTTFYNFIITFYSFGSSAPSNVWAFFHRLHQPSKHSMYPMRCPSISQ